MRTLLLVSLVFLVGAGYATAGGTTAVCREGETRVILRARASADSAAVSELICSAHVWAFVEGESLWTNVRAYDNGKEGFVPTAILDADVPFKAPSSKIKVDLSESSAATADWLTQQLRKLTPQEGAAIVAEHKRKAAAAAAEYKRLAPMRAAKAAAKIEQRKQAAAARVEKRKQATEERRHREVVDALKTPPPPRNCITQQWGYGATRTVCQ